VENYIYRDGVHHWLRGTTPKACAVNHPRPYNQSDSTVTIAFDNSYARLPDRFYQRIAPTPVASPRLVRLNRELALHLGLDPDWLAGPEGLAMLSGNRVPSGADPIAMAYAGHQFGQFVPQLGDGRAILLGEVIDRDGVRRDIQLKGSGRTSFSRRGDGRAALGPVLREYIVSEAMAALGIPTTRSLAAVLTGETVLRDGPMPGAVLTRVASSHIRIGTFQFFAARGDVEGLRQLADHVIARHYPDLAQAEQPYRALLDAVIGRQAELVGRWLLIGFIHGVMNTDNMSVSGETIDYGPCAFMDAYHPATVFSAIDHQGRYSYSHQPGIAHWNLTRLAEALLPLLADDQDEAVRVAQETLDSFPRRFEAPFHAGLRRKLGLVTEQDGDLTLAQDLLSAMAANQADFTLTFRRLSAAAADPGQDNAVRALFADPSAYDAWAVRWRQRLADEPQDGAARRAAMRAVNPMYTPRNHRVEAVIQAANEGDFAPFVELLTVLAIPYDDQAEFARYALPPEPHERVERTFCGT
jgi:serine/tyrosine/threonine adenylyltransferase